eukprot:6211894-Pleurochrysis_carterae.AAC.2
MLPCAVRFDHVRKAARPRALHLRRGPAAPRRAAPGRRRSAEHCTSIVHVLLCFYYRYRSYVSSTTAPLS